MESFGRTYAQQCAISNGNGFDGELALLETLIAKLEKQLQGLLGLKRRQRNEQLPGIARLPDEILVRIFSFSLLGPSDRRVQKQHALARVSSKWAHLVISSPSLWNVLSTNDQYFERIISRSRNASLDVTLEGVTLNPGSKTSLMALAAFDQIHRWRSIDMYDVDVEAIRRLMTSSTPRLTDLCIMSRRCRNLGPELELLSDTARRLHHVTLIHIPIRWDPSALSQLRTLELEGIQGTESVLVTQICDMLRASPGLITLVIGRNVMAGSLPKGTTPVYLSQLLTLNLSAEPKATYGILGCIRVPNCTNLTIDPYEGVELLTAEAAHLADPIRAISSALKELAIEVDMTQLSVIGDRGSGAGLKMILGGAGPTTSWFGLSDILGSISTTPSLSVGFSGEVEWVHVIPKPETGQHITSLTIDANEEIANRWIDYLSEPLVMDGIRQWPLPRLETLGFYGPHPRPDKLIDMIKYRSGLLPTAPLGGFEPETEQVDRMMERRGEAALQTQIT
ncbi:hypothetical protein FRB94_004052 [Tulasnella sp. JGI-2019a]|nr:hypothetical protein FRB94_004052 [Tulasnella sp. JGI-2019a]